MWLRVHINKTLSFCLNLHKSLCWISYYCACKKWQLCKGLLCISICDSVIRALLPAPSITLSILHRHTIPKQQAISKFSIEVGCLFFHGCPPSSPTPRSLQTKTGESRALRLVDCDKHTHRQCSCSFTYIEGSATIAEWECLWGTGTKGTGLLIADWLTLKDIMAC